MADITERQQRLLAIAFQCMETEPKIDYEKFAQLAKLKNAATARESLRQTKKKLLEDLSSGSGTGTSTPKSKGKPEGKSAGKEGGKSTSTLGKRAGAKRGAESLPQGSPGEDGDVDGGSAKKVKVKKEKIEMQNGSDGHDVDGPDENAREAKRGDLDRVDEQAFAAADRAWSAMQREVEMS